MKKVKNTMFTKLVEFVLKSSMRYESKSASGQIEKKISLLEPGRDAKILVKKYYQKKLKEVFLLGIVAIIILVFVAVMNKYDSAIKEGYFLARNGYGQGTWNIEIEAEIKDEKSYPIMVEVEERTYSIQEATEKIDEFATILPQLILGENESITHITKSLTLRNSYQGYPFSIRWISDRYGILQDNGNLGEKKANEHGEKVLLFATISYGDVQKEISIETIVFPKELTETEKKTESIKQLVENMQAKTSNNEYLQLPDSMNGNKIVWKEKEDGLILLLLVISVIAIIGVWIGRDNDLSKKCKERDRYLSLEYSEFVSKLQLLIGSGMTIRGAVEKVGEDYKKYRKDGGNKKYVYEELSLCIRKLQDGVSEAECYDYFGKRCNLLCYKKLTSLLIQNLRKGTSGLLYALSNETKLAFEERKQQARRLGEEAQTKLLFPMILMLGVVMIVIMIPAYMSFGGV